jgi:hypothetical protein
MDPFTSLVTALAAGAASALPSTVAPVKEGAPDRTRRMTYHGQ